MILSQPYSDMHSFLPNLQPKLFCQPSLTNLFSPLLFAQRPYATPIAC